MGKKKKQTKYLVMTVQTHMEVMGRSVKVDGCDGYMPVFDKEMDAINYCSGTKWKIIAIN